MSCSLIVKEKVCLVQMLVDVCKHVSSIFFFRTLFAFAHLQASIFCHSDE